MVRHAEEHKQATRQRTIERAGRRFKPDGIVARPPPEDPQSARGGAIGLFTVPVGTLRLSRNLLDREFADDVLDRGTANTLAFLRPQPYRQVGRRHM
ncbi:hypothetical protein [Streptomyces sp. NPDC050263]|uniref:hypothetical protein n=1 Tax=Streptomyces sp. NPDC050263 TaxID=3155037 RepID=UPI0034452D73